MMKKNSQGTYGSKQDLTLDSLELDTFLKFILTLHPLIFDPLLLTLDTEY